MHLRKNGIRTKRTKGDKLSFLASLSTSAVVEDETFFCSRRSGISYTPIILRDVAERCAST